MDARLKLLLLCIVVFVLLMLGEALGVRFIATPGYLVVRTFTPLPEPYRISDPDSVHRTSITVANAVFWASVVGAWVLILNARKQQR